MVSFTLAERAQTEAATGAWIPQFAAIATASSVVNRGTTESSCSLHRHSRGNGHGRLAATAEMGAIKPGDGSAA